MARQMRRRTILVPGVLAVLVACAGVAGASQQVVRGSGHVVEEKRDTGTFSGVALHVVGDLEIEIGNREELRIEAEDNLLDYIVTEIKDDVLTFNQLEKTRIRPTRPVRFFLTTRRLDGVTHAAGGRIHVSGINSRRLTIQHRGSGRIQIDDLELETLFVHASGSGRIDLGRTSASRCQLTLSGSGDVTIGRLTGLSNDVRLTGSGDVSITRGTVVQQTVFVSGSGEFKAHGFSSGVASVLVSGSGSAFVRVKDQLDATITGDGDIHYRGDPKINRSVSGSGRLKQFGWTSVFPM